MKTMQKEKIPLAIISRQDGAITIELNSPDTNIFELYGFLKIYLETLEDEIYIEISEGNNK